MLGKTGQEIKQIHFNFVGIKAPYKALFGNIAQGAQLIVYGKQGQGKSTFAQQFANYWANTHGSVAYLALEEGYSATLQDKIKRFKSDNIRFFDEADSEKLQSDNPRIWGAYSLVIIDSTKCIKGFSFETIKQMKLKYPKSVFLYVMQVNKKGQALGAQSILHECDVEIEVIRNLKEEDSPSIASCNKSRFGKTGNMEVAFT